MTIGEWDVHAATDSLARNGCSIKLEPRLMRVLLALAARPGEVVSVERLLAQAWPDVVVTPESAYQAIAALRRALGDTAAAPTYIVNVPRRGYRLIAPVRQTAPPVEVQAGAISAGGAASGVSPFVRAGRMTARPLTAMVAAVAIVSSAPTPPGGASARQDQSSRVAAARDFAGEYVAQAPDESRAPPHILWVDDKPQNNLREREAMASFGVRFDLSTSTADALARLRRDSYSLVISDMRRGNERRAGYELLEAMRERSDHTRLVFYTSSCTEVQMQEARTHGALGCAARISELMNLALSALETYR